MRRTTLAGVLAVVAAAIAIAAAGPAAAASGGCSLNGTASFNGNGLSTSSSNFTYSFTGTLDSCQSSDSSAPAKGVVNAGKTWTDPATGNKFQEPLATGTGGCSSSTTDGTAIVQWADGTVTIFTYHTTGATAAVALQGTVIPSLTLTGTDALGNPTSTTITTTRYANASALGTLAFEANPTDCTTGVKSAGIAGVTALDG
jgi:hypothetical protein